MNNDLSQDAIFHGALQIIQARRGYRFTEDAVYIAAFMARSGSVRLAADFGAGCGIIGLALLFQGIASRVIFVELQQGLAEIGTRNIALNGFERRGSVLRADLRRTPLAKESLGMIISNPPYIAAGRGNLPRGERAIARHEIACTPAELAREATRCLRQGGVLGVVYPAQRSDEVIAVFRETGLQPTRRCFIRPSPAREPSLVLLEARKEDRFQELVEEPEILSRDDEGERHEAVRDLFAGRWERWLARGASRGRS